MKHCAKHFFYAGGRKKFEPLRNLVIKTQRLSSMTPMLEAALSKVSACGTEEHVVDGENYGAPPAIRHSA